MARIDYFFSTVSPWVYLSGRRLEGIAASHGATVAFRPVDPGALFARTGGLPVNERHPSRQAYRLQELRRWSAHLGTPLNLRPRHFPVNPAPSAYAVIAADRAGGGDLVGLIHGFSRAVWAEERDIADEATLVAIATEAGLDADRILAGREAAVPTYERNTEDALAAGMFGAPWYQLRGEGFWGQDRLDLLDHTLGR